MLDATCKTDLPFVDALRGTVSIVFYSDAALRYCVESGRVPNDQTSITSLPILVDLLRLQVGSTAIVVSASGIDDRFVDAISACINDGLRIGILPFHDACPAKLLDILDPTKASSTHEPIGFYCIAGIDRDSMPQYAEAVHLKGPDVVLDVQAHRWAAMAASSAGRQTYISFGPNGCLHPGLKSSPARVITPEKVECAHWFLQSCHSPFTWSDFGDYLSVPQAFILKGTARTFICSVREQTFIPGLLKMYIEDLARGLSVGEIVHRLNNYCKLLGFDENPFLLFGHPDSVLFERRSDRSGCDDFTNAVSMKRNNFLVLQNLVSNIKFISSGEHFELEEWAKHKKTIAPNVIRFNLNTLKLVRIFQRKIHQHFLKSDVADTKERLDCIISEILQYDDNLTLEALSRDIRKIFLSTTGYYYHLGSALEKCYIPVEARLTNEFCSVCQSRLHYRSWRYAGLERAADYDERLQFICPRCLVTRDCGPQVLAGVITNFSKSDDSCRFTLTYRNITDCSQWVYSFSTVTDP